MKHIMLDLETWGTTPGSDIRSIGACVFDPQAAFTPISTFYRACDNPRVPGGAWCDERQYPLTRDPRTVQWWSEQSVEAQTAFADPIDLKDALLEFGSWLVTVKYKHGDDQLRLWSHGAAFDGPILAAAYQACGLDAPWHYRAIRDTRTLFDAAGIEDHSAWLAQHAVGTTHHALDDAICQAGAVCAAYGRLRSGGVG